MNTLTFQPDSDTDNGPSLLAVLTLVLWLMALIIGVIGLLWDGISVPHPQAQAPPVPPVVAELVTPDPEPPPPEPEPDPQQAPPDTLAPPEPAQLALAAAPSAAIAFAVPVDGPVRIVSAGRAGYVPQRVAAAVVHHLVLGQGEGRQPPPEYPAQALLEEQEGVVVVRFTVGEDGRVITADLESPSRWPLLNQAALDVVRDRWRLLPGAIRTDDVRITFRINRS